MDKQLESNEFEQLKLLVDKRHNLERDIAQVELHRLKKTIEYEAVMEELGTFQANLHSKYGDVKIDMKTGQVND